MRAPMNGGGRPVGFEPPVLAQDGDERDLVPVNLQATVTEIGTLKLKLRCLEKNGPDKWKLELNVRMKE